MKYFIILLLASSQAMAFVPKRSILEEVIIRHDHVIFNTKNNEKIKVDTGCSFEKFRNDENVVVKLSKGLTQRSSVIVKSNDTIKRCNIQKITML